METGSGFHIQLYTLFCYEKGFVLKSQGKLSHIIHGVTSFATQAPSRDTSGVCNNGWGL